MVTRRQQAGRGKVMSIRLNDLAVRIQASRYHELPRLGVDRIIPHGRCASVRALCPNFYCQPRARTPGEQLASMPTGMLFREVLTPGEEFGGRWRDDAFTSVLRSVVDRITTPRT